MGACASTAVMPGELLEGAQSRRSASTAGPAGPWDERPELFKHSDITGARWVPLPSALFNGDDHLVEVRGRGPARRQVVP